MFTDRNMIPSRRDTGLSTSNYEKGLKIVKDRHKKRVKEFKKTSTSWKSLRNKSEPHLCTKHSRNVSWRHLFRLWFPTNHLSAVVVSTSVNLCCLFVETIVVSYFLFCRFKNTTNVYFHGRKLVPVPPNQWIRHPDRKLSVEPLRPFFARQNEKDLTNRNLTVLLSFIGHIICFILFLTCLLCFFFNRKRLIRIIFCALIFKNENTFEK